MNNKGFAITTILYGILILFLMLLLSMLGILATYKNRLNILIDDNNGARCIINGNCIDPDTPNAPVLDEGMIPVTIDDDGTVVTVSEDDPNWYDYKNKKWANIVLVNEGVRNDYKTNNNKEVDPSDILAYFVWIPRYKYKLFPALTSTNTIKENAYETPISIKFESQTESMKAGTTDGQYHTHPAFWWDNDSDGEYDDGEMLSGIWVGKFETSGDIFPYRILPHQNPAVGDNVKTQFFRSMTLSGGEFYNEGEVIFDGSDYYGLTSSIDSHMMKNSEWGAVAYLTHSKYGTINVRPNNDKNYTTGCGASSEIVTTRESCAIKYGRNFTNYPQSTTGNITGVFDMSGGAAEAVMANYGGYSGFNETSYSGFAGPYMADGEIKYISGSTNPPFPASKYYDLYTQENYMLFGHATYETLLWYNQFAQFSNEGDSWLARGYYYNTYKNPIKILDDTDEFNGNDGHYYGLFNFSNHNGSGHEATSFEYGYRIVLISPNS